MLLYCFVKLIAQYSSVLSSNMRLISDLIELLNCELKVLVTCYSMYGHINWDYHLKIVWEFDETVLQKEANVQKWPNRSCHV